MSAALSMPATERSADFGLLVSLSEALRGHCERGEWGTAAEVELERRAVIERVFEVRPAASELPELVNVLREVVRINDELLGLAEHRRRALAGSRRLRPLPQTRRNRRDHRRASRQPARLPALL